MGDPPWIHDAVGYEVYVRSFSDSDGDGLGDLDGVRQRLDHLVALGVDVLWLTPVYPSPDADHGYDVADYRSVRGDYGGLAALERLLEDAHARGLHVVMDIVPNHSSDQHPWFIDARSSRDAPHREWYVWRDPGPDGGPPNNWLQRFGGPAWTLEEATGQYWMHLYLPSQPDLNWRNPAVRAEFLDTLRTWFERGMDGFRIDVAHTLLEDPEFRDNPLVGEMPGRDTHPRQAWAAYAHEHDIDQDETPSLYAPWREVADEHDAVLIGEVYLAHPDRWARYTAPELLHSSFWFPTLHVGWDAEAIRSTLEAALVRTGAGTSWPVSSHDDSYATTRFGGGERGRARALAYLTLCAVLPGSLWLMQGEELGLEDAALPADALADPVSTRNAGVAGRDGTRAPMIWETGPGRGFTTGEPWLPFGDNRPDHLSASAQWAEDGSHLTRVRDLLHLRRSLPRTGAAHFLDNVPVGIVGARVGETFVLLNTTGAPVEVAVAQRAEARFVSTRGTVHQRAARTLTIPADGAVVAVAATRGKAHPWKTWTSGPRGDVTTTDRAAFTDVPVATARPGAGSRPTAGLGTSRRSLNAGWWRLWCRLVTRGWAGRCRSWRRGRRRGPRRPGRARG